ncbi:hypothetical protein O181_113758 [Austropuccinia psidii MF-1]|uniref:Uncharacterized protein n=1 Tax=Austropuccinia psidii MF-1 TaxID=1389203 RepID=A0A9Q3K336_9BASI|nr:hypothetical protein [Austropuccinia psidii MF-1]
MPMISAPQLETSMSNSNRDKSHSEGSIYIYIAQYKGKDWEMLPQIHQGLMSCGHILKNLLKEEEIVRYSNGLKQLSSKPQIKKIKEYHAKKKEERKEEAPVASTRKPQASQLPREGEKNKKKN